MKIRELSLLFYSLFLVAVILLYLIYTKQGIEGFEPISNFDDEKIQKNPLPRINCEPGDKKITVTWTQNNSNVKQYLIAVRPVRHNKQSIMYKVHENPKCSNCECIISGLKNGELYEVRMIVFLKNNKQLYGQPVTVIPNGPLETDELSSLLMANVDVSDEEIDVSCDYFRETDRSNHALDKSYVPLNEYVV